MLRIEKTLQDIRELQKELAAIGVNVGLKDPVADDMAVAVVVPCSNDVDEEWCICSDGHFCDHIPFYEYRRRLCSRLARYYRDEAEHIVNGWKELCGGEDTSLPDNLRDRHEAMEKAAEMLYDLIKDVPPMLTRWEYEKLKSHLLRERLCEQAGISGPLMQDASMFETLSSMGLVQYSGVGQSVEVTKLGKRAMRQYERERRS
ncbi:hypothetical protein [Bifidobacterium adolescentis]|uniref:hypothetical protein n=1 Tax=Bifidobacterium adolescentis TaxID=1680 RepID=UPI0018988798|nr:hypothetical protein [Bifidobacterium adolescentis]MDB1432845.1 hypothetical protein [Bifidobacterium adolescentis]MDB1544447.1 hypothetical protein [Bifidobacterium adolescentis]